MFVSGIELAFVIAEPEITQPTNFGYQLPPRIIAIEADQYIKIARLFRALIHHEARDEVDSYRACFK